MLVTVRLRGWERALLSQKIVEGQAVQVALREQRTRLKGIEGLRLLRRRPKLDVAFESARSGHRGSRFAARRYSRSTAVSIPVTSRH
jgi:hypothetical protein